MTPVAASRKLTADQRTTRYISESARQLCGKFIKIFIYIKPSCTLFNNYGCFKMLKSNLVKIKIPPKNSCEP